MCRLVSVLSMCTCLNTHFLMAWRRFPWNLSVWWCFSKYSLEFPVYSNHVTNTYNKRHHTALCLYFVGTYLNHVEETILMNNQNKFYYAIIRSSVFNLSIPLHNCNCHYAKKWDSNMQTIFLNATTRMKKKKKKEKQRSFF